MDMRIFNIIEAGGLRIEGSEEQQVKQEERADAWLGMGTRLVALQRGLSAKCNYRGYEDMRLDTRTERYEDWGALVKQERVGMGTRLVRLKRGLLPHGFCLMAAAHNIAGRQN